MLACCWHRSEDVEGLDLILFECISETGNKTLYIIRRKYVKKTEHWTIIWNQNVIVTIKVNWKIAWICSPEIIIALQHFTSNREAVVLLHVITKFTFVLRFHVLINLLKYCKSLSDYLQTDDLDLVAALNAVVDIRTCEIMKVLINYGSESYEKHQTSGFSTQDDLSIQPCKTKVAHKLVGSAMNSFIRVVDSIDTLQ